MEWGELTLLLLDTSWVTINSSLVWINAQHMSSIRDLELSARSCRGLSLFFTKLNFFLKTPHFLDPLPIRITPNHDVVGDTGGDGMVGIFQPSSESSLGTIFSLLEGKDGMIWGRIDWEPSFVWPRHLAMPCRPMTPSKLH